MMQWEGKDHKPFPFDAWLRTRGIEHQQTAESQAVFGPKTTIVIPIQDTHKTCITPAKRHNRLVDRLDAFLLWLRGVEIRLSRRWQAYSDRWYENSWRLITAKSMDKAIAYFLLFVVTLFATYVLVARMRGLLRRGGRTWLDTAKEVLL